MKNNIYNISNPKLVILGEILVFADYPKLIKAKSVSILFRQVHNLEVPNSWKHSPKQPQTTKKKKRKKKKEKEKEMK